MSQLGRIAILASISVLSVVPGQVAAPAPTAPPLTVIPSNTWVRLDPPPTLRHVCFGWIDCSQTEMSSNPVGRSTSGVAYGDGKLLYFGGGHHSHPGNDVELYDIAANVWTQQYAPEGLPRACVAPDGSIDYSADPACAIAEFGLGVEIPTPGGRPYVQHAFREIAYHPVQKLFVAVMVSGTWTYDPATATWRRLTPDVPDAAGDFRQHVLYSPDLGEIIAFPLGEAQFTFRFDFATATWIQRNAYPDGLAYSSVYSAYDSRRLKHLVSSDSGRMWWYDAVADTWTELTGIPAEIQGANSVAYDSLNAVALLATTDPAGTVVLWTYDQAGLWTRRSPTGVLPQGSWSTAWGTLNYDPINQVFLFVNVQDVGEGGTGGIDAVETWVYRFSS